MSKRNRGRPNVRRAQMVAAYVEPREDELLDAIASAAALAAFSCERTIGHFEHRVRQSRESGGASEAIRCLSRHGNSPTAFFIMDIGEKVVAADRYLDPGEEQVLQRIRAALEGRTP